MRLAAGLLGVVSVTGLQLLALGGVARAADNFVYEASETVRGEVETAYRVDFSLTSTPDGRLVATSEHFPSAERRPDQVRKGRSLVG